MTPDPWTADGAPIVLRVPARRVKGWKIIRKKKVYSSKKGGIYRGDFKFTPPLPGPKKLKDMLSDSVETLTLVPYGCTQLRMTIFPRG